MGVQFKKKEKLDNWGKKGKKLKNGGESKFID